MARPVQDEPTPEQVRIILVLEDCQWIDPLSRDLAEVLARDLADLPVLLLIVEMNERLQRS